MRYVEKPSTLWRRGLVGEYHVGDRGEGLGEGGGRHMRGEVGGELDRLSCRRCWRGEPTGDSVVGESFGVLMVSSREGRLRRGVALCGSTVAW